MIGWLRGRVVWLQVLPPTAIVETGGVGYELRVGTGTLARLGKVGNTVELYVHTHMAESELALFGFAGALERDVFRRLIGVGGVGPRLALDILSGMSVEDLIACIRLGRQDQLQRIKGVGKKTAERLVVELRDRLDALAGVAAVPTPVRPVDVTSPSTGSPRLDTLQEALAALETLGYPRLEASRRLEEATAQLDYEHATVEDLVRLTLRHIGGAREAS